jgi:hypothetical protein
MHKTIIRSDMMCLKKVLITIIVIFLSSLVFSCDNVFSTSYIPNGSYSFLHIETNKKYGSEFAWYIKNGIAEHRYLKFNIIYTDESTLFTISRPIFADITYEVIGYNEYEYKAQYDRSKRVLYVWMPGGEGDLSWPTYIPYYADVLYKFTFVY